MKNWPNAISINQLSKLLGKDRRTLTVILQDIEPIENLVNKRTYDLREAIEVVFKSQSFGFEVGDDDNNFGINPQLEKARLDRARRLDIELNLEVKKKNLIPTNVIEKALTSLFGSVRAKTLNIPAKVAQRYQQGMTKKQVQALAKEQVNETLKDLSEEKALNDIRGI